MLKDGKDELIFGEVVEERVASKHVAAGAFVSTANAPLTSVQLSE